MLVGPKVLKIPLVSLNSAFSAVITLLSLSSAMIFFLK